MNWFELFCALLVAHAFFDYAGQGDFMAAAKNPEKPMPGIPWYQPLTAHALIHAGAVGFLTGHVVLGFSEFIIHWTTDYLKCKGWFGYSTDQFIHIICKIVWVHFWLVL